MKIVSIVTKINVSDCGKYCGQCDGLKIDYKGDCRCRFFYKKDAYVVLKLEKRILGVPFYKRCATCIRAEECVEELKRQIHNYEEDIRLVQEQLQM